MSDILKDPVALSGLRGKVIEEIRAWCEERGLETYVWIKVDEHCAVDRRFVNEHRVICLDISTDAVDVGRSSTGGSPSAATSRMRPTRSSARP